MTQIVLRRSNEPIRDAQDPKKKFHLIWDAKERLEIFFQNYNLKIKKQGYKYVQIILISPI
jgi:hypothetical protein